MGLGTCYILTFIYLYHKKSTIHGFLVHMHEIHVSLGIQPVMDTWGSNGHRMKAGAIEADDLNLLWRATLTGDLAGVGFLGHVTFFFPT